MLQTIVFSVLLIAVTFSSYFLDDYIEAFEENFLNFNNKVFSQGRSEILLLVVPTILILSATYYFLNRRFKKEVKRLNCNNRISVEEYERNKMILTQRAVKNLIESSEYQQYLKDKESGALKDVVLKEDDKIELSDDSDVEDDIKN